MNEKIIRPVGEFNVSLKKKGKRTSYQRKVVTNGVRGYQVQDAIVDDLLEGYEVRLVIHGHDEAIRLYPCVTADYKTMYVAAQTMGSFRNVLSGVKFKMTDSKGRDVSVKEANDRRLKGNKRMTVESIRESVTPDMVVTCPKCGNEFRVGRKISK